MSTPLIAIVAYHLDATRIERWSSGGYAVPDPYVDAVRRAGSEPALLAPPRTAPVEELITRFDGLLLIGGGDVDPEIYEAAERHAAVYSVDPDRDRMEIDLIRQAASASVPTLAICRGAQVMNVAFGGTLIQHLPDHSTAIDHRKGRPERMHLVEVADASLLREAMGQTSVAGASRHHQGIDKLGDGLVAVGRAPDGLVEAIEHRDGWMLGVQWHPEVTAATDSTQQALFDALARRAATGARVAGSSLHPA